MSKILILGIGRSGTTNLIKGLGDCLPYKMYGEPFNRNLTPTLTPEKVLSHKNVIVKTLIDQMDREYWVDFEGDLEDFYKKTMDFNLKFLKNFDNVILLSRKNQKENIESRLYQRTYGNKQTWHVPYFIPGSFKDDKLIETVTNRVKYGAETLEKVSKQINIPITWYEDLYSGDKNKIKPIIDSWGLEIEIEKLYPYLDPSKKYRQNKKSDLHKSII